MMIFIIIMVTDRKSLVIFLMDKTSSLPRQSVGIMIYLQYFLFVWSVCSSYLSRLVKDIADMRGDSFLLINSNIEIDLYFLGAAFS